MPKKRILLVVFLVVFIILFTLVTWFFTVFIPSAMNTIYPGAVNTGLGREGLRWIMYGYIIIAVTLIILFIILVICLKCGKT